MGKRYLVALDDGHGMNTPGKRTPKFPANSGMKSETGKNYMHENEFNRAVVKLLDKKLKKVGVGTVLTAPGDADHSLNSRVLVANKNGASILVSIHANAHLSQWGTAEGVETYHYPGSVEGKKLATLIQKELVKGTPQRNRGVKAGNFYILRKSKMPSVLVEAGFMDNLREAKLLLSDSFREEVAHEVFIGVCKYLNVKYDQEAPQDKIPKQEIYRVRLSWDEPLTQKGAYSDLSNAKEQADKLGDGYKVYDSKGNVLYPKSHWADKHFDYLNKNGITIHERRFSDPMKRGEVLALLHKLHESLITELYEKVVELIDNPTDDQEEITTDDSESSIDNLIKQVRTQDRSVIRIPFSKIQDMKVVIADNELRQLSMKDFQSKYDFDYTLNGGFYWSNKSVGWRNVSVNTVFDGQLYESSGDFSKFTMMIKDDGSIEWGEFTRGNTKSAIGGGPSLIKDGKILIDHELDHSDSKQPRTAIGTTDTELVLVTIDGRDPARGKYGMTISELAAYMKSFGVTNAINLDGGASTTLMKGDEYFNTPLAERRIHNAIGVWIKD